VSEAFSDDHEGYDDPPCPRCDGDMEVDCHCGGDLCVCLNYGRKDCPFCYGEGTVSEDRRSDYFSQQRAFHDAMMEARK